MGVRRLLCIHVKYNQNHPKKYVTISFICRLLENWHHKFCSPRSLKLDPCSRKSDVEDAATPHSTSVNIARILYGDAGMPAQQTQTSDILQNPISILAPHTRKRLPCRLEGNWNTCNSAPSENIRPCQSVMQERCGIGDRARVQKNISTSFPMKDQ